MRINKFVAGATGLSRRAADSAIQAGRVSLNQQPAQPGDMVVKGDTVTLDSQKLILNTGSITIMLHKPVGYVSSRNGQGRQTIYDLLPIEYHHLKPVGRLDKDSSGLLLLTNDGGLANRLTHPRFGKTKVYEITLNKPLEPLHQQLISNHGIQLEDGPSQLALTKQDAAGRHWHVTMREGRNRQIRRTFATLGYEVKALHRTHFGPYQIGGLRPGGHRLS